MKIFELQFVFDDKKNLESTFFLDLIFCDERKELDTYWFVVLKESEPNILFNSLILYLENWENSLLQLKECEGVFLSIGLWDEYIEGFYVTQINNQAKLKIEYGYIEDWGLSNRSICLYNVDKTLFHKEFEANISKEAFLQDIRDNLLYINSNKI